MSTVEPLLPSGPADVPFSCVSCHSAAWNEFSVGEVVG